MTGAPRTIDPQDDVAIRSLVADMLDAVARGDADAWGACWTDDGVWVIPGYGELVGPDAVARFAELRREYDLCLQALLSGRAEVDGDRGTGRWYFRELQHRSTSAGDVEAGDLGTGDQGAGDPGAGDVGPGPGSELYGCYDDEYVRTDSPRNGGWRFARRRFWVLYRGSVALDGTVRRPPPAR
jgi:SnoaL-like domain